MKVEELVKGINTQAAGHCPENRVVNPGEPPRQGDVYIREIDQIPPGCKETKDRQLAPGNTKGSRHTAEGNVRLWVREDATPLQGPIIEALEPWRNGHPEHCNYAMPPGIYEVGYQRDLEQEEVRRVQD